MRFSVELDEYDKKEIERRCKKSNSVQERYDILHTEEIWYNGQYYRSRKWVRGHHPNLQKAILIMGWTGPETIFETYLPLKGKVK